MSYFNTTSKRVTKVKNIVLQRQKQCLMIIIITHYIDRADAIKSKLCSSTCRASINHQLNQRSSWKWRLIIKFCLSYSLI